jgi:hypothetical protein
MRLLIPLLSPKSIAWGRLTRGLAIAKAAQAAGHEVAFCASGQLAHRLLEAGSESIQHLQPNSWVCPPSLPDSLNDERKKLGCLSVPAYRSEASGECCSRWVWRAPPICAP